MVDLSQFVGFTPNTSTPPQTAPQTAHKQPSSVQPPQTQMQKIDNLIKQEGMKNDEPLKAIFETFAKQQDDFAQQQKEFAKHLASYGPDTGRLAAESASLIMRQNMGRVLKHMKLTALALGLLGTAGLVGLGVWSGWTLRGSVASQIGNASIPREMAERFAYQNWQAQWQNRQILPADKSGFVWAWVPMVETMPNPPKRN